MGAIDPQVIELAKLAVNALLVPAIGVGVQVVRRLGKVENSITGLPDKLMLHMAENYVSKDDWEAHHTRAPIRRRAPRRSRAAAH